MAIAEAEESVNILSLLSLILFVKGTADDADDINKYAITCPFQKLNLSKGRIKGDQARSRPQHL